MPQEGRARPQAGLDVAGLIKRFGASVAVAGVDLSVRPGEFFTVLGPSGCGKTTLLRMVAGILVPDGGRIAIGGRDVTAAPIWTRRVGLVFQNYALFPHMSVAQNVGFGLAMQKVAREERTARVARALGTVRLDGYEARRPSELSGGQQQRVALARAIVTEPDLLLLDEPLSNLDARLREDMRAELLDLQRRVGITTVLVTHDIHEAFALSDRVAVMRAGRVEQLGAPTELYDRPANRFVAGFLGPVNEWEGRVEARSAGQARVAVEGIGSFEVAAPETCAVGQTAWLVLRPERVRIEAAEATASGLIGRVDHVSHLGNLVNYRVALGARALAVQSPPLRGQTLGLGQSVRVTWHAGDVAAVAV
ncbi:MAG: ABC transporter ATP-binding protein [Alphaproteobacteria bacterium]|nr:ABC transporter ATP-binding protein [Alphaproteobacteria bacterium]